MTREPALDLAEFVTARIGDYLRLVLHYDVSEHTVVHIRDDVEARYTEEALQLLADDLRVENVSVRRKENYFGTGTVNSAIRCYANSVGMHFPTGDLEGTAVSMDPQAQEDLYSFVGDCLTVIGDSDRA